MDKELPRRKDLRLTCYDYSSKGAYYVTICTQDRRRILSDIVKPSVGGGALDAPFMSQIQLTDIGRVTEKYLLSSENIPGVKIDCYVIMPDHIHVIIFLEPSEYAKRQDGSSRAPTPTNEMLPQVSSTLKYSPETGEYAKRQDGSSRAPTPTNEMLPHVISTFKRFCHREIGSKFFQRGYIEHIIRDREDYETRRKYIYENPMRWYFTYLNTRK
jgi:REP element-mobilizing transposase RayT